PQAVLSGGNICQCLAVRGGRVEVAGVDVGGTGQVPYGGMVVDGGCSDGYQRTDPMLCCNPSVPSAGPVAVTATTSSPVASCTWKLAILRPSLWTVDAAVTCAIRGAGSSVSPLPSRTVRQTRWLRSTSNSCCGSPREPASVQSGVVSEECHAGSRTGTPASRAI